MQRIMLRFPVVVSKAVTCVAGGKRLRALMVKNASDKHASRKAGTPQVVGYARPLPDGFSRCLDDGRALLLVYRYPVPVGRPWLVHQDLIQPA